LKEERLLIIDRIRFQECRRNVDENETIFEFVERAEKLIEYCNYGEKKNELLLQQVLCGMKDLYFQKDLLAIKKLDWNIAKQNIMARRNRDSQLQVLNPPETVKKIQSEKSDQKHQKRCKFCGTKHRKGKEHCPAYGKSCSYCKKPKHFEKVCLKKAEDGKEDSTESSEEEEEKSEKKKKKKNEKRAKDVKRIHKEGRSSDSDIFTIRKATRKTEEVTAMINLKVDEGYKQGPSKPLIFY
jgi:hypothetical protein